MNVTTRLTLPSVCLVFALILIQATGFAQRVVFRYPEDSTVNPRTEVEASFILHSPGDGHTCVVLKTADNRLVYLLLDRDFRVEDKIETDRRAPSNLFMVERAKAVGSPVYTDSTFHYFFVISPNSLPDRVYEKTIDFRQHTVAETQQLALTGDNEIMGQYLDQNNRIGLIATKRKSTTLDFYTQNADAPLEHANLDVSQYVRPDDYFGHIHFVPEDVPQQLDNLAARTLAFRRGHQLVLFTQRPDSALALTIVDLSNMQAHVRAIHDPEPDTEHYSMGSSVEDDKIFRLLAFDDRMELDVYQIPSLQLLRKYTWNNSRLPIFAMAPVNYVYTHLKKEIVGHLSFSTYVHGLRNGLLGLAVNKTDSGQYLLTIGSYKDSRSGYNTWGHPIFFGGEDADVSIPEKGGPTNEVGSSAMALGTGMLLGEAMSNRHPVNFDPGKLRFSSSVAKIVLDSQSLDNIPGANLPLGDTRLADYLHAGPEKSSLFSFRAGGKDYTGAFEKASHAFLIREISP